MVTLSGPLISHMYRRLELWRGLASKKLKVDETMKTCAEFLIHKISFPLS
jgi:hypothetical protein